MALIQATGRRKSATAKILMTPGTGKITINKQPLPTYFANKFHQEEVVSPLRFTEKLNAYDLVIQVTGGGTTGQRQAIRHGISRALKTDDPETKAALKAKKLLTRDPRRVERKKYGKLKARKSRPFVKR